MAKIKQVALFHDRKGWGVDVVMRPAGVWCYRYESEAQARYFAAVFALGPRVLPPPHTQHVRRRRRARLAMPLGSSLSLYPSGQDSERLSPGS